MALPCPHWFWYIGESHPCLARTDRLREVTSTLPSYQVCPSLIVVAGRRQRPPCSSKPKRHPDKLSLDLYDGGEPLLVATASLTSRTQHKISCCHPSHKTSVNRSSRESQAVLYSRLLYPFADVFCFYAYTKRDLSRIADHLVSWMQANHPGLRNDCRPQLVIVLEGHSWENPNNGAASQLESHLEATTTHRLGHHFSEIEFIQSTASYEQFHGLLKHKSEIVKESRRLSGLLFSIQHTNCLFERFFAAIEHFPTSYIQVSRQDFAVKPDMAKHIANFLDLIHTDHGLRTFGAEVVASSILLDNYPPGMHRKNPNPIHDSFLTSYM